MPTRPSVAATDVIQDAKQLLATAKMSLPALTKADKAKGKTQGTNAAFLKKFEQQIAAYEATSKTQRGSAAKAKASTRDEVSAREALSKELKSIRDDVADAFPEDKSLHRDFGKGKDLDTNSTKKLLDHADFFAASFETHGDAVKPAGVTQKRMTDLAKKRQALAEADAKQRGHIGQRVDATASRSELLAQIRKSATALRRRLASVSGDGAAKASKKTKGSLASTTHRRTVTKRAAKKTAAPAAKKTAAAAKKTAAPAPATPDPTPATPEPATA
jgi:chromosome segregation ATPase